MRIEPLAGGPVYDDGREARQAQGALVNVGDPSACSSIEQWSVRWIREDPRYRALGVSQHRDPEWDSFTYGDYIWKPAKANLAKMEVGDWIFFNETLIVAGVKLRYLIAGFKIAERINYQELAEKELLDDPRYAGNAHVYRNRLIAESDTRFTIWRGGSGSRLLAEPVLMDRGFMEELALPAQDGSSWDWAQRDRRGRAFRELQIIGFHTRATRRLDERQTAWMLERMFGRPARALRE